MQRLKSLTDDALASIESGDHRRLAFLINENFDIRRAMCRLSASHVRMVEIARSVGASAKFAGSGGAIIGTYEDDTMLAALREKLGKIGCRVFRPDIG